MVCTGSKLNSDQVLSTFYVHIDIFLELPRLQDLTCHWLSLGRLIVASLRYVVVSIKIQLSEFLLPTHIRTYTIPRTKFPSKYCIEVRVKSNSSKL